MHSMWSFTETTHEVAESDLKRAVAAITAIIPPDFCSEELFHPDGYDDLVSCVLDAVGSVGVRYAAVENGIARFRTYCAVNGVPQPTTPAQFLSTFSDHLDDEGAWFAANLWNYQRTSTQGGVLKNFAMQQFFEILAAAEIETAQDLLDNITNAALREVLRSVKGQSDSVSIIYLFMLAGYRDGVKDDRMIGRYFERLLGKVLTTPEKAVLLMAVADQLRPQYPCVDANMLDHLLWLVESGRWSPDGR